MWGMGATALWKGCWHINLLCQDNNLQYCSFHISPSNYSVFSQYKCQSLYWHSSRTSTSGCKQQQMKNPEICPTHILGHPQTSTVMGMVHPYGALYKHHADCMKKVFFSRANKYRYMHKAHLLYKEGFPTFILPRKFVIPRRKEIIMTQEELRETYRQRLVKEKQSYISKVVKIDPSTLSKFKNGKFDLYPDLFDRLQAYLLNN